jgi:hypothetical protein
MEIEILLVKFTDLYACNLQALLVLLNQAGEEAIDERM